MAAGIHPERQGSISPPAERARLPRERRPNQEGNGGGDRDLELGFGGSGLNRVL